MFGRFRKRSQFGLKSVTYISYLSYVLNVSDYRLLSNYTSKHIRMTFGGSILGPLLFFYMSP